jgi:putative transcriptional regulator
MAKRKKVKVFEELKVALADSLRYEQGQPVNLRVTELPPAPKPMTAAQIKQTRLALNASQALFARFLNVSTNTVESWEQGTRVPQHAALKLLRIARLNPGVLLQA